MTVEASDIVSDGSVRLHRQRTDIPFTPDNIMVIETGFKDLQRIDSAFTAAMKKEAELSTCHPFAWNPEFGYVTARPAMCGTGLQISALFHLEGLHLIGDLEPAKNALSALRMTVRGCEADGMRDAAHIFRIENGSQLGIGEREILTRVKRAFSDLCRQESNARIRLVEEMPRVFEDAIARSLAVLRACRLISEWELLDIVSPLRLAAELGFLENFTRKDALEITRARLNMPVSAPPDTYDEMRERDRQDAALADKVNKRFRNVRLNAYAKDRLS